jgi:hypothetical protein
MAKPLVLQFGEETVSCDLVKVDRAKLYGFKEPEVLDEQDRPCELATLASDGKTVISRGGTAIGNLTPEGLWCDRAALTPVDLEGQPIPPVPSSFDAPILLEQKVSVEQFLDYDIRSAYLLRGAVLPDVLRKELEDGAVYQFPFSFRGGVQADPAFLLTNSAGELFLLVGQETNIAFVGLQQAAALGEEDQDAEDEGEGDELDFTLI